MFDENEEQIKYITFRLEDDIYAIHINHVLEIIGVQETTVVPDVPNYMIGLINLRGEIIPVIDTRLKFKKPKKTYDMETSIIVSYIKGKKIGLVVDRVIEVMEIKDEWIDVSQVNDNMFSSRFLHGVGLVKEKIYLLIDANKILTEMEFEDVVYT